MQDFARLVRQNEEDVEHSKGDGWNGKEIHRDQVPGMIAEEVLPSLIGAPSSRPILSDGGIRDGNAQLATRLGCALAAPGRIGGPHSTNQGDEFAVNGGSAAAATRFPAPEQAKALAVPAD